MKVKHPGSHKVKTKANQQKKNAKQKTINGQEYENIYIFSPLHVLLRVGEQQGWQKCEQTRRQSEQGKGWICGKQVEKGGKVFEHLAVERCHDRSRLWTTGCISISSFSTSWMSTSPLRSCEGAEKSYKLWTSKGMLCCWPQSLTGKELIGGCFW